MIVAPLHSVFVYGTLRRGCANHRLLEQSEFRGYARTKPCYTLVDLGGFPGMIFGGSTQVLGEVYLVDDGVLADLDFLESCPRFYRRRTSSLDDGRSVMAYTLPRRFAVGRPQIGSGDWLRRDIKELHA